jgi:hypothetical protein
VRDEDVAVVHLGEDVFAAASDALDPRAAQKARELARRVLGREPRSQKLRRRDDAPADETVEGARDEFDFGQLGHLNLNWRKPDREGGRLNFHRAQR